MMKLYTRVTLINGSNGMAVLNDLLSDQEIDWFPRPPNNHTKTILRWVSPSPRTARYCFADRLSVIMSTIGPIIAAHLGD